MAEVDTPAAGKASRRAAMIIAALSSFITPFMGSSVNVALPSIGNEFALNAVALGWVASSYSLAAAIFLIPFGRIADIYGRKRVFTYGIALHSVSSVVLALSPSATVLIAFRVLQGIGGAMIFGTGLAILTSVFPASERGKVLGINVAFVYLGLSLGPTAGGFLTQHLGWRSVFLSTVPFAIAIIVAVVWKLSGEWADARGERFDLAGSLVYGLSLAGLMYGFSILPAPTGIWLIAAGLAGFVAFARWEMQVKSPVLSMSIFRGNPAFLFSNLAALVNYSATFAVGFLLSLYLQYIKGFTPAYAGLVLVSQPAVMAALSPVAGKLSDKFEPGLIASIGMGITTLGTISLTFLHGGTGLGYILACLAVLGVGFGLFSSPNTNAIMSSVEKRFYGVASGTLGTMRLTGQTFSMAIAMLLFSLYMGRVQITPEYYAPFLKSVQTAFIIFTAMCFGGVFASLARGRTRG